MAYHGRRGPNVSEYIANLNAIPTAQDMQNSNSESFLDDDLAMFTNTQFFDFDLGQDADMGANGLSAELGLEGSGGKSVVGEDMDSGLKGMEFPLQGDFAFPDFNTFSSFEPVDGLPAPINTSVPYQSAAGSPPPSAGLKRKSSTTFSASGSSPSDGTNIESSSRVAAEEDKRRRNTAASARFRVKKKQREQALEKSAKEMSDKVAALEGRINMLETENKWLKNLITERNESKEDIKALWEKYSAENGTESKAQRVEKGVGTAKKVKA